MINCAYLSLSVLCLSLFMQVNGFESMFSNKLGKIAIYLRDLLNLMFKMRLSIYSLSLSSNQICSISP